MFVEYLLLNSIAGITDLEKQKRHLLCSGKTFWLAKKLLQAPNSGIWAAVSLKEH